ncbi:MAG: 1-acyl-sn-glycerol-3-phosphate acyltransferase [Deltaproteobacteria bacterium]|nr:1-acyl-sn-glycerol-3-phosphate acyltransferase [Deltaproteobacteria bacterium]
MALRFRRRVSVRVGEIDSLENMVRRQTEKGVLSIDRSAELAYGVRRELIRQLDEERRVVLGPIRKSRSEIIEAALHNRRLVTFLREYSRENNVSFVESRSRARRYLREMAGDYSAAMIGLADILIGAALKYGRGRVEVDDRGLKAARVAARRMPLVYVPCHKSHFDYLLVSYVLYQKRLSLPFILAGINLNFWPVGPMFRACGAFFSAPVVQGQAGLFEVRRHLYRDDSARRFVDGILYRRRPEPHRESVAA